ncbi:MAG: hypothetical protein PHT07_07345 [Paludibacter sp.]|nr:hypothetical protein [Paludibacter sp.]
MLTYIGFTYYNKPIEERFFDPNYALLKPSGFLGHGLGVIGSFLIVFGIFSYMIRKRVKMFVRVGVLKYWLEFHIFLCTLGSVFVVYHTTFKFGGIVSVGFWSLAIVWTSGLIGRYIYIQIPHTIEGRELTLKEIQDFKSDLDAELMDKYQIDISEIKSTKFSLKRLKLISKNITVREFRKVKKLIRAERRISRRIERLDRMQNLFKYWHVAHLPFALIMLIIMVIHIAVVLTFGYKWIF